MAKAKQTKSAVTSLGFDDNWRAESDMRTLMDAEAIRKDPKRLAAAKAFAVKKYKEMEEAGLCGKSKAA